MGAMMAVIVAVASPTPTVGVTAALSYLVTIVQTATAVILKRRGGPSLVTFRRAGYAIRGITIPTTVAIAVVAKSTPTAAAEGVRYQSVVTARAIGASTSMMS